MHYRIIIIGSGPAGLTAGIYSSRAKISTAVIEGNLPGGQLTTTTAVENWPGDLSVQGQDLMERMRKQAQACGATLLQEQVSAVDLQSKPFTVTTQSKKTFTCDALIIATGSSNKKLGCRGEQEYFAKGVSTCATCDGAFYCNREVIVVGGGNTAMTEAEHLLHFVKKVTIVHILDALTANDPIKDKVLAHPQASFIYNATVTEIKGNGNLVTGVLVKNQKDGSTQELKADGVFVAIGFTPNTTLFKGQLDMDQYGYLKLQGHTQTSVQGVFAAGDVADFMYRQAITSAGMGCMAALDAQNYLARHCEK